MKDRISRAGTAPRDGLPNSRPRRNQVLMLCLCLETGLLGKPLMGQTMEEEVRLLRLEVKQLRDEVKVLKDELHGSRTAAESTSATSNPPEQTEPSSEAESAREAIPLLQAQVAEQAQTKVESNSRFPVKIFGSIVSSTFFNTGEVNWLDDPNTAMPAGPSLPRGSFSSTLRQSRVGAIVDGPALGSMRTRGFMAIDFFGGIPNFQTGQVMGIPRLLYAYARLEGEKTSVEFGQDHMILAPRNPTSLAGMAFPTLYRSGNLYLRVPQIRIERVLAGGEAGRLQGAFGLVAPIGGDLVANSLVFVPPNLAGERSRRPALQARIAWNGKPSSGGANGWEVGFSGHYGRERYLAGTAESWATAVDLDAQAGRFGVGGEWFVGKNIDAFGGSIGQLAKSTGGFVEVRLAATQRLEFNTGFGTDQLFHRSGFAVPLVRNPSVFANTIFRFTPEVAASFEYRWLQTNPEQGDIRHNHHFNLVLAYSF